MILEVRKPIVNKKGLGQKPIMSDITQQLQCCNNHNNLHPKKKTTIIVSINDSTNKNQCSAPFTLMQPLVLDKQPIVELITIIARFFTLSA